MELVPLSRDFGVEVRSVDLADVASSESVYRAVRTALEEHSVLLFRQQDVTDDVQAVFSRAFGPLERVKVGSVGAGTFYSRLHNMTEDGIPLPDQHRQALNARANQLWHTDSSFKPTPALASVLSARIVPAIGGETEFASTRVAWSRLPSATQGRIRDAIVTHAYANSRDQIDPQLMTSAERAELSPVRWRMTWRNPINGCVALYIASHAYAIDGMDDREAKELLADLIAEATRQDIVYRHHWRRGDVLMWDNRATMHRGRPWQSDQARSLVRTTITATEADGLADVRPPR